MTHIVPARIERMSDDEVVLYVDSWGPDPIIHPMSDLPADVTSCLAQKAGVVVEVEADLRADASTQVVKRIIKPVPVPSDESLGLAPTPRLKKD